MLDIKNHIRLNTKSTTDIHPLLKEVMYDVFGLIIEIPELKKGDFRLSMVCNYHNAPIGKKTNWGGHDKNYPTEFLGWELNNIRGTFRTKYNHKITDNYIKKHSIFRENGIGSFWTTDLLKFSNGINTGSFNGGSDFMGCFRFFLSDFPHLKDNFLSEFHKKDIIKTFGIKDWDIYLRSHKIKKIKNKIKVNDALC
jgi:hypothetical protein